MKTTKFLKLASIVVSAIIFSISTSNAQERNKRQQESLLSAKKWTIVEVKRKKLGKLKKMDGFRLEVGNEFSMGIDHKFGYKNNDYEYMSGKWVLNGKELLLIHRSEERRVGKECSEPCDARWSPEYQKKKMMYDHRT